MKELTIEEKAKRYDEAIERAKKAQQYDDCNVCPYIFPELKESEDKRMKKSLIRLVKAFYDVNFPTPEGFTKEQLLSWIEKQGENNIGISEATKQKLEDNLNMTLEKETQESWNEFLDKQGEQKPTDWSEEDEKRLDNVITQLKAASNIIVNDEIDDSITFIKSLKVRVQPKQEWSKEDIDMIDYLIRCCETEHEELCNDRYGHQDIISDLKRDCRKKWDWFESLKNKVVPQSQWKPSKEQIMALRWVLNHISYDSHKEKISGLLDQLNKLMEK